MKFAEMTAYEIKAVEREQTLVMFPIAACEQHGKHMPTYTDSILCGAVASAVEQKMPEAVLLLPTLWVGASQHHLRWGGTLTATLETYTQLLCEISKSALDNGFRRLLLLNGHGGNIDPMHVAMREMQLDYRNCLLSSASYWSIAEGEIAACMEDNIHTMGHACEVETSLMMHLRPELVKQSEIEDGSDFLKDNVAGVNISRDMLQRTKTGTAGSPHLASPEKGAKMFTAIVEKVSEAVAMLQKTPLLD